MDDTDEKAPRVSARVLQELRSMLVNGDEGGQLMGMRDLVCPRCPQTRTATTVTAQGTGATIRRDERGKPIAVVACPVCGFRVEEPIEVADA